jgi:hypothetical protein
MRTVFFIVIALISLIPGPKAHAQSHWYQWCAHYGGGEMGSAIACGFTSWGQCMASVSGVGGVCYENAMPPPPRRSATRKRDRNVP